MSYEARNIRILPSYIDHYGFIRPEVYDLFCQEAEAGLFESLNFDPIHFFDAYNICFVLRGSSFDYPKPVKAGEFMDVKTLVKKVGTTSLTLHYTFYNKNGREAKPFEVATAERTLVAVGRYDRTSRKLPSILVESIRKARPKAFENDSQ